MDKLRKIFGLQKNDDVGMKDLKKELDIDDHKLSKEELESRYSSIVTRGLSPMEAELRLLQNGPNALLPPPATPEYMKFLKTIFSGFSILLWIAALMCFVAYGVENSKLSSKDFQNLYLGLALIAVILISGIFSYFQEARSGKIMESFKHLAPPECVVLRAGKIERIPPEKIVVGDIVQLKSGDAIPADMVVVACTSMKVDNSSLTGESEPQPRFTECSDDNPMETKNLMFFGSNVVEGTGRGLVIKVGNDTMMGRIANLTTGISASETPIALEIKHFIKVITTVAVITGFVFFFASLAIGYNWEQSLVFLIGIIVANVPEGLLVTVTVSLTLTAQRMAKRNCLIKNLESVETLGSTSTICSDKTGTLTQNRMSISHLWLNKNLYEADLSDEQDGSTYRIEESLPSYLRCGMLCSRAEFIETEVNMDQPVLKRECVGDASEVAILKFVQITNGKLKEFREDHPKIFEIPFNSVDKFQASIHKLPDDPDHDLLVMKGAPERIIQMCSRAKIGFHDTLITEEFKNNFAAVYEQIGGYGERVLAFCEKILHAGTSYTEHDIPKSDLVFLGLISLIDPPRPNVPDSVAKCRSAGIRVIMVTGDHPLTAKAIARAVGIISPGHFTQEEAADNLDITLDEVPAGMAKSVVLSGQQLKEATAEELDNLLREYSEIVFARTSPQQKLLIVEACQRLGAVVAVTGDGVNDSPALKQADIGIAMGISGSDVSKQTSDMILLDDNFASIVAGIEEGRLVFDNLKKSIAYTLTSNIPEIMPFLLHILASIPLPLATITILFIDLGTDMLPAVSLAHEKAEADIMSRKPRDPKGDKLVNAKLIGLTYGIIGMIQASAGFMSYYLIFAWNGWLPSRLINLGTVWVNHGRNDLQDSYGQEWTSEQRSALQETSQTMYFWSIVVVQWADLLICKTRMNSLFLHGIKNHILNYSLVFETLLALALMFTPGLNRALKLTNVRFEWLAIPVPFAIAIFAFDEVRKWLLRKKPTGWVYQETYY